MVSLALVKLPLSNELKVPDPQDWGRGPCGPMSVEITKDRGGARCFPATTNGAPVTERKPSETTKDTAREDKNAATLPGESSGPRKGSINCMSWLCAEFSLSVLSRKLSFVGKSTP